MSVNSIVFPGAHRVMVFPPSHQVYVKLQIHRWSFNRYYVIVELIQYIKCLLCMYLTENSTTIDNLQMNESINLTNEGFNQSKFHVHNLYVSIVSHVTFNYAKWTCRHGHYLPYITVTMATVTEALKKSSLGVIQDGVVYQRRPLPACLQPIVTVLWITVLDRMEDCPTL